MIAHKYSGHCGQEDGHGLDIGRAERGDDYITRIWRRSVSLQPVKASGNPYVITGKQATN
jgi:hypothetical protein